MAKYLEAMERARQERMRRTQQDPAAGPADPVTGDSETAPAPAAAWNVADYPQESPPNLFTGVSDVIVGMHEPQSPVSEQIRHIRANMEAVLADVRSRTIVVSSPVSGDGKTMIAANLASILADAPDQQVLLVDADMRKGRQHELFGLKRDPGLSEYLREQCSLDQALRATKLPNLTLLPAGRMPDKPTVLLGSERMASVLGELQRHYDWILFDTPPLLPVTDATILAREAVGLILVVRMGITHRGLIDRAQDLLAEMRLPVLGCILNDFHEHSRENQYYYKYYSQTGKESAFRS
jgi:capsular exopolysaccharide synthesis family protein